MKKKESASLAQCRFLLMIDYKLVCNEREALEGNDLQILVLLGEPLGYSSLVTIAELGLLIT